MIASVEYARVHREIAQLIDNQKYAEAYVLAAELRDFATSKRQLVTAAAVEAWLMEKLCMTEPKRN